MNVIVTSRFVVNIYVVVKICYGEEYYWLSVCLHFISIVFVHMVVVNIWMWELYVEGW